MPTATFSSAKPNCPSSMSTFYLPAETARKPSRLKSGLAIFSKLTNPFTTHNEAKSRRRQSIMSSEDGRHWSRHHGRPSFSNFFQNLLGDDRRNKSNHGTRLRKASPMRTQLNDENINRNSQTVPAFMPQNTVHLPVPQGILIKRNPSVHDTKSSPHPSHVLPSSSLSTPSQQSKLSTRHQRHSSHVSSSMTVNSENLTAKEFADIAGIRILSDNDSTSSNESHGEAFGYNDATSIHSRHMHSSVYSLSSLRSHDAKSCSSGRHRKPQIWDTEFWQSPDDKSLDKASLLQPKTQESLVETLRRTNTRSSDRLSCSEHPTTHNYVIKKGRFEIHLETADTTPDHGIPTIVTTSHDTEHTATTSSRQ